MKPRVALLVAGLLAAPALASAQAIDLGPDVSGYTRFVVYPHLQKGWESMQRGERDRALKELERARALAPGNAAVALQLATAYRRFGETARAVSLLREQLQRTPNDARVTQALAELEAASRPAPPVAAPPAAPASAPATVVAAARPAAAAAPKPAATRRAAIGPRVATAVRPSAPTPAPLDPRAEARTRFAAALRDPQFADAAAAGAAVIAAEPSTATLDEVSFTLVDAGAADAALDVLLDAYPFAGAPPAQRETLFQRMIPLLEARRHTLAADRYAPLRRPLDTPALRSRQAVLWTAVGDCETVRAVLADGSPAYGHDDWLRLGDCAATTDPALARRAYASAHAAQPGGRGSLALAYGAFADGDYRASLDAWKAVGTANLTGDALIAASTTALAADDDAQASAWLDALRARGDALDDRYWSLLGRARTRTDVAGAIAAFERAVALRPDLDDLLRLAQLDADPAKRVHWLEQAVAAGPGNAATLAELGYAYARAEKRAASLDAFERAAAIDPSNSAVQVELGFAYWRVGRTADSVRALERAWQADPSNLMVTRQLVYGEQRLANNTAARFYAERVLDAPGAFAEGADGLTPLQQADLQFGFRRLHEDLGRRVTVNLDGFSGTRVGAGASSAQPGSAFRSYSQVEADVRLGKAPVRDGRTISAYARVFADGGDLRSALPSRNAVLGAGLRWKPWRSQVIYVAAEGQNGLEDGSRRDVMLRASASFLNGGRFGDDWHPARSGWMSQNLYVDAARYLKSDFGAFTADYRTSYHKRIADGTTLEPYGHAQFNVSGSRTFERDLRVGAGVRWNVWHGGSKYDAAPHKLSLGLEFQQALQTYLPDRNGLFLTLGSRW